MSIAAYSYLVIVHQAEVVKELCVLCSDFGILGDDMGLHEGLDKLADTAPSTRGECPLDHHAICV